MGSSAMQDAAKSIIEWSRTVGRTPSSRPKATEIFGELTFNDEARRRRLPGDAYRALRATIECGEPLEAATAEIVATAMKDWAVEHGATHYTHWFQPMTGITAEKHDSFVSPTPEGRAVAEFSGKELIRGEPDASSFPSGGMRSTFEARGYTAWDPTSPPWLLSSQNGTTLVIPTIFVSWTGDSLDQKTPLLRSMEALSKQAVRILKLFKTGATRVVTTCGPEQEYFLIDRNFYFSRPDLINAGRTLFGAKPPKGQEMEDQYFGSIPERVLAFMQDVENELYRVGVPVKTRHNEVAPSQYEIAPLFENANVATDHQMMTMEVLKRVAPRYGLACLLHEKPFAGVNGSGKHLNWSMADDQGGNLLNPGETPDDNVQFLVFCAAMLRAVNRWQGLLRMSIAGAGNDHRLGANEAPPAIISVFLGEMLTGIFERIEKPSRQRSKPGGLLDTGVSSLPKLPRDAGDRNRTSPFAFTGNKFEFRAVSANQSIAFPNIALNVAMAESLDYIATALEKATQSGRKSVTQAVKELLPKLVKENKRIIFNGNGYSDEWRREAEKRELLNIDNTVDALGELIKTDVVKLFETYRVFNARELKARHEVGVETYVKTLHVEAQLMVLMANRYVMPSVVRYLRDIAESVNAVAEAGGSTRETKILLQRLSGLADDCRSRTVGLAATLDRPAADSVKQARYTRDTIVPAMESLREAVDQIESLMPHEVWPLPTYREMLFVK